MSSGSDTVRLQEMPSDVLEFLKSRLSEAEEAQREGNNNNKREEREGRAGSTKDID